ncbi:hypothetical protein LshimejAT787_1701870 [Lyophyllum shimeji]|uniref:Uncharacterized protein n=1 Tax=Lyophyllum shimeji TaxID=47721 RepID=A0A9P3UUB5_LYOSH|nr:hypothetical protein LshimejAT787_1701870 [Lyophyllum shimeji]
MGGFARYDDRQSWSTLNPHALKPYLRNNTIEITEKEIWDKSKGDGLAKFLVLLQVTWFILQFLARAIEQLSITALEVATLAFAVLNVMTYLCWWNKPLDVQCPVRVHDDSATAVVDETDSVSHVLTRRRELDDTLWSLPTYHAISFPGNAGIERRPANSLREDDHAMGPSSAPMSPGHGSQAPPALQHLPRTTSNSSPVHLTRHREQCDDIAEDNGPMQRVSDSDDIDNDDGERNTHVRTSTRGVPIPDAIHISADSGRCHILHVLPQVVHTPQPGWSRVPIEGDSPVSAAGPYAQPPPAEHSVSGDGIEARTVRFPQAVLEIIVRWFSQLPRLIAKSLIRLRSVFLNSNSRFLRSFVAGNEVKVEPCDVFYFGHLSRYETLVAYMVVCCTGTIFGALHCIAWSFQFPSDAEEILWRLSSIAVTCLPVYGLLYSRYISLALEYAKSPANCPLFLRPLFRPSVIFLVMLYYPALLLYLSARLILTVQMFVLLRASDTGIFQTVQWLTFIPHF